MNTAQATFNREAHTTFNRELVISFIFYYVVNWNEMQAELVWFITSISLPDWLSELKLCLRLVAYHIFILRW